MKKNYLYWYTSAAGGKRTGKRKSKVKPVKFVIITKDVKDVIRKNRKLIKETVDINKTAVIIGNKEYDIKK